jgi:predicted MFS family arabinose efflux permease
MRPHHALIMATGGMIAMAAAMGIGRFVYTPILPFMEIDLGLTKAEAGLIATANFAGYLAGALLAAWPGLKGERRVWCAGMLAFSALPTGLMAATTSLEFFMAMRFAGGLASAFVLVFGSSLVLEALSRYQRPALSALHFGGVGLGIALSAVLVARMGESGLGWREQWMACAALILIAAVIIWPLIKDEPGTSTNNAPQAGESSATSAPNGGALPALIIGYGLFGFGYVITATFISTIVHTETDISFLEPWIWLIVGLSGVPSVYVWTLVARRFGTARGFALACLVESVGVLLSVLGSGPGSMVVSAILLGGTFMGITALGLMRAREFNSSDSRRLLGLMTASFGLGQMIGPSFAGYAWQFGNSFLFPSLAAAIGLLIAAALTGLRASQS